jgi:hypothetical protein
MAWATKFYREKDYFTEDGHRAAASILRQLATAEQLNSDMQMYVGPVGGKDGLATPSQIKALTLGWSTKFLCREIFISYFAK